MSTGGVRDRGGSGTDFAGVICRDLLTDVLHQEAWTDYAEKAASG